jgi:hypothetical protein
MEQKMALPLIPMKTFARYDPEKGRTYPITVGGVTRWAKDSDAVALAYCTVPLNIAIYAESDHSFRGFSLHLFEGELWTISTDSIYRHKHITYGRLRFDEMVRLYDADPRWVRMDDGATKRNTTTAAESHEAGESRGDA